MKKIVMVRGMDSCLWKCIKVAAIKTNKTIAKWLSDAAKAQLKKEDV